MSLNEAGRAVERRAKAREQTRQDTASIRKAFDQLDAAVAGPANPQNVAYDGSTKEVDAAVREANALLAEFRRSEQQVAQLRTELKRSEESGNSLLTTVVGVVMVTGLGCGLALLVALNG